MTPEGWVRTTVGDLCAVIAGQSPPGSSYNVRGEGMPFFQGKAEFGELRPTVRKWTIDGRKFAERDDILLSVRAPVGPTNLAPSECVIGRGLAAIRPLADIDPRYILYALRASAHDLVSRATGSTFSAVTGEQVRAHPLPLAPLAEQRRIAAAIEEQFSRLDAISSALGAVATRLDALTGALVFRATESEWPLVALSSITTHQTYGTSAKCSADPHGVPVLRMGNIDGGRVKTSNLKFLPREHPDASKFRLKSGDLLFNRTNSPELVGKSAVYRGDPPDAAFASYLIRVRFSEDCLPAWASLVINSPYGRAYIAAVRTQQVGQANVNGTKLAAMPIPLPPIDEQQRIVAELEQQLSLIDSLRAAVESAQKRSAALRRAILERAFRGELVPQDPDDEPASELLERIRAERAARPKTQRRKQPIG